MSLQAFLNQSGLLKTRSGYDEYGKEKQNTAVTTYCRFQETQKTNILPDGSTEPIDAVAFLDPSVSVNPGDHFVFNSIDYRVLSKNSIVDGRGLAHHSELNLQKWQS